MDGNKWFAVIMAVLLAPFCLYVGIVEGLINRRVGLSVRGGDYFDVVGNEAVIWGFGFVFIAGFIVWRCYQIITDND